jgi:hypothetical protein
MQINKVRHPSPDRTPIKERSKSLYLAFFLKCFLAHAHWRSSALLMITGSMEHAMTAAQTPPCP